MLLRKLSLKYSAEKDKLVFSLLLSIFCEYYGMNARYNYYISAHSRDMTPKGSIFIISQPATHDILTVEVIIMNVLLDINLARSSLQLIDLSKDVISFILVFIWQGSSGIISKKSAVLHRGIPKKAFLKRVNEKYPRCSCY